jgi:hypothetical protein
VAQVERNVPSSRPFTAHDRDTLIRALALKRTLFLKQKRKEKHEMHLVEKRRREEVCHTCALPSCADTRSRRLSPSLRT